MKRFHSLLVLGGTGSFGRAFVKRILELGFCDRVCVLSRGEHAQAAMRDELGDDPRLRWFIGDVRDAKRLELAMHGVDAVVHAAALKRIEVGWYNPGEMVKTNVTGAMNAIQAAVAARVKRFVYLSTDKAYRPASPYGHSKALAESLVTSSRHTLGGSSAQFVATRYGNIWGSQGSVGPKWKAMVEAGSTRLPVTDPDCTRFFMTMDQAVDLVLLALTMRKPPELLIPPELPAYRLGDLVEAFGCEADVKGLPEWEKKHESMSAEQGSWHAPRMSVAELKKWIDEL